MATGFDRRQPTRDTFAFKPAGSVQVQAQARGQSRGAQLVGGQSAGEGVAAGPQTDAGPVAAGLGQFVEQIMAPHVKRKQQEEFFKGFTRAEEGVALDEITTSSKGMSKIFGPTAYEQGAQFFTAKDKLNTWQTDRLAEMDKLKRMKPEEAAKVLAATSQEIMTGDPFADQLLQQGLIEVSGPLMNTVSKARYEFQQVEAVNAWTASGQSGASALQALITAQGKMSSLSDGDTAAMQQQMNSFLGSMVKPEGMADESYQKGLYDFMRTSMQDGNFHAVNALRRQGIDRIFGEDDQLKLEAAYEKYGKKALADAARSPERSLEILRLDTDIRLAEIKDDGTGVSAMDAASRYMAWNEGLKRDTGVDDDLVTLEDIRGAAGSVVGAVVSASKRAQDRQWQLQNEATRRAQQLEDRAADEAAEDAEEAQDIARVQVVWGLGGVVQGIAGGMKEKDFEVLAVSDYQQGNIKNIVRSYKEGGWVSNSASSLMKAKVTQAIGTEYNKSFQTAHQEWQRMYKANPSAAQAYYGEGLNLQMQRFNQLVGSGSPQMAFASAFGDTKQYAVESVPKGIREKVTSASADIIANNEPGFISRWFGGQAALNESSAAALTAFVEAGASVAVNSAPGLDPAAAARQRYESAFKNGQVERWGAWAVTGNPVGTKPLNTLLAIQDRDAEAIIGGTIERKLKAAGFTGDNGRVIRINNNGKPALMVQATSEDGDRTIPITFDELVRARDAHISGQVSRNQVKHNTPRQRFRYGRKM